MGSMLSVAQFERSGDLEERSETALLGSGHLMEQVPYLGTHILTLPTAIWARQKGLHLPDPYTAAAKGLHFLQEKNYYRGFLSVRCMISK